MTQNTKGPHKWHQIPHHHPVLVSVPQDSLALHFAQTFNCHTGREKSTYKRRNTQQSIRRQDPRGTRVEYIQQMSRVISKTIQFSLFFDEEIVFSCCQCHYCSHYLNITRKVKYVSPPGGFRRYHL